VVASTAVVGNLPDMRHVTAAVAVVIAAVLAIGGGTSAAERTPAVQPFHGDIEKLTEQSSDFRRVLFTGAHTQVVAMSIAAGEDIGDEVHRVDQCFFFVDGKGQSVVSGQTTKVEKDEVLCVPAGLRHNIRNTGSEPLKLYTIYSPPQHPAGTVHHTKQDAQRAEAKPSR
jgi:mannose-6-phosphate isomerase-like protein (cupin superfamily)